MSSSPKLRRFTPPTCTLEIYLSRRTAAKPFFCLSFDDPCRSEAEQVTIQGNRQQLERLYRAISDRLQKYLSASFSPNVSLDDSDFDAEIKLNMRSSNAAGHQLIVNFSDNDNSVSKVNLTTVQLFDLVAALDAYSSEAAQLSQPKTSQSKRNLLVWGSCATATIVAAIALIVIDRSDRQPEPVITSPIESSETIPEFEAIIPPPASETKEPIAEPQLNEPITSAQKLPPPLPVDAPKPQPDIPDPANFPPAQPLDLAALEPPVASADENITVIPETDLEPQQTASNSSQVETELPNDVSAKNSQLPEDNAVRVEKELSAVSPDADDAVNQRSPDRAKTNNNSNSNNATNAPDTKTTNNNSNNDNSVALNSSTAQTQLQQVEQYFQQTWQPPEQLTETIQYRLVINSDGAIARIFPIGKAAEVYLDRTNMPLMGETFVDPSNNKQTVRLMLSPDGEVATFAE